jgi:hypothetical protein
MKIKLNRFFLKLHVTIKTWIPNRGPKTNFARIDPTWSNSFKDRYDLSLKTLPVIESSFTLLSKVVNEKSWSTLRFMTWTTMNEFTWQFQRGTEKQTTINEKKSRNTI